jgi:hypothetical protein
MSVKKWSPKKFKLLKPQGDSSATNEASHLVAIINCFHHHLVFEKRVVAIQNMMIPAIPS